MYASLQIQILQLNKENPPYFTYSIVKGDAEHTIFKDIFNVTGGQPAKPGDSGTGFCLWLVVHSIEDFICADNIRNSHSTKLFAQDLLTGIKDTEQRLPIIHITTTDIFLKPMYGQESLHRLIPRSHLIIDSSIWNFHVSIFGLEDTNNKLKDKYDYYKNEYLIGKTFRSTFIDALDSINKNHNRHLYNLHVANEYADLNARLLQESYLTGAHAKGVSPFVFHSEDVIRKMIYDEFVCGDNIIKTITEHKWRILLLDDKAVDPMGCHSDPGKRQKDKLQWNCKLAIIKDLLEDCLKTKICHRPCNDSNKQPASCLDNDGILIEYAQSLNEAEQAMQSKKYDIVLLDYLLDADKTGKRTQNYGYSLLNSIYNDKCRDKENTFNNYKLGPSGRFFFMFISAYSTAVYERLLAEGLNLSEDFWHISLGACPTNTPQLFLYNLLQLMKKRLKDSGLLNLSATGIHKLADSIYNQNNTNEPVRKRANHFYEQVLELHYHYRKIMKDVSIPIGDNVFDTKGSVLMTEFIKSNTNLGGLLEHFANLVHLTAFGTIRQWPEMWEEYLFFKALYCQLPQSTNEEIGCDIEKHILSLKSKQE